jgi:hypothetical protein
MRALDAILKTSALNLAEPLRHRFPSIYGRGRGSRLHDWRLIAAQHARDGPLISAAKSLAVLFANLGWEIRIAIFISVVYVWIAVVFDIAASTLDSVAKAAALDLTHLLWRLIPCVSVLTITRVLNWNWCAGGRCGDRKAGSKKEDQCGNCKAMDFHNLKSPFDDKPLTS